MIESISCLFQLLEAACILGSWPVLSSKLAVAGQVFLTLNHSMTLLPLSSTFEGLEFVCKGCHTKVPQAGSSNNRNFLSHSSGGQMSRIKVLAKFVPFEGCEGMM